MKNNNKTVTVSVTVLLLFICITIKPPVSEKKTGGFDIKKKNRENFPENSEKCIDK